MISLIKAEWFRIKHSGNQLILLILVCLAALIITFVTGVIVDDVKSVLNFNMYGIFACCIMSSNILNSYYNNRTAFYEIMDGRRISEIIFSKVAVYQFIILISYIIPFAILSLLLFDSIGIVEVLMISLIFFRLIFIGICIDMIFKSMDGAAVVFVRILIELLLVTVLYKDNKDSSILSNICDWFSMKQCSDLYESLDVGLIFRIIASLIFEGAIFYILAYFSYKKKWTIDLKFK